MSLVIKVRLVGVSRADAPAVTLGEQSIETAGKQVPFPFVIADDPARVDERMSYAVHALDRRDPTRSRHRYLLCGAIAA